MKRIAETDRFLAKTDTGKEYVIIEYQEYIDASSFQYSHAEIAGVRSFRTSDGLHVNYIDPKTFTIVETNENIRKV